MKLQGAVVLLLAMLQANADRADLEDEFAMQLLQHFTVQRNPRAPAAAERLPNIIDIFAALPPVPLALMQQRHSNREDLRVAVCATGHLRTFVMPGVFSGLVENVLRTVPGAGTADVYMIGHLGAFEGSADAQETVQVDVDSKDDPGLKSALAFVGISKDRTWITRGDCSALQAAWQADGIANRACRDDGNFMQIMWLDRCIDRVRKSGKMYDIIVRTRPDVGVFAPIPWKTVSMHQVSYMPKDAGGRADWFFTMPWLTVDTWWDKIAAMYLAGSDGLPDYTVFNEELAPQDGLAEVEFPAAIVRGRGSVQCFRIVGSKDYEEDCEQKEKSGYFEELHR